MCQERIIQNPAVQLCPTEIPEYPFQRVRTDLFELRGKNYFTTDLSLVALSFGSSLVFSIWYTPRSVLFIHILMAWQNVPFKRFKNIHQVARRWTIHVRRASLCSLHSTGRCLAVISCPVTKPKSSWKFAVRLVSSETSQ